MTPEPRPGLSTRIAILNAHWAVHSSVSYLATHLEQAGYEVDVFLHRSDESLSGDLLQASSSVNVHRCDPHVATPRGTPPLPASDPSFVRSAAKAVAGPALRWLRLRVREIQEVLWLNIQPERGLISNDAIQAVVEAAARDGRGYAALLGVEKGGLMWAGLVAARTKSSLVYYNLELYTRDHPWVKSSARVRRFKAAEEKYHRLSALTIVQDPHRGRILLADNGVPDGMPMAYLPVSLIGPGDRRPSTWLQAKLGLPAETVTILSYGMMSEQRRCVEQVQAAQRFPATWCLVFHGYGDRDLLDRMRAADVGRRTAFSLDLVPVDDRQNVVRSAQIGLAVYNEEPINDRLTGFSSEKIALYFQCGLPLIAVRHASYEHIEAEGAGVLIQRMEEIPEAVERILADYDRYVAAAYRTYEKHYRFETNVKAVVRMLQKVTNGETGEVPGA